MANQFSERDLCVFRLYRDRLGELLKLGVHTRPIRKLSMSVSKAGIRYEGYGQDDYRSYVLGLRQFIMDKEPIKFVRVCDSLVVACTDPHALGWVRYSRDSWNSILDAPTHIHFSGVHFSVKDALDADWYWSGMIHSDLKQLAKYAAMPEPLRIALKMEVQGALMELTRMLVNVDCVVRVILEDAGEAVIAPPQGY